MRKGQAAEDELNAQDLLPKSHEELVFALIKLRRRAVTLDKSIAELTKEEAQMDSDLQKLVDVRASIRDLEERRVKVQPLLR